jgi:peroxiredoxin family protein
MGRKAGIKLYKKEKMSYKVLVRAQKMPVHSYLCQASIDVMTTAARNLLRKYSPIYAT